MTVLDLLKQLPDRPTPKVNVVVVEALEVHPGADSSRRLKKVLQDRSGGLSGRLRLRGVLWHGTWLVVAEADPTTLALCLGVVGVDLLAVVGWVTEDDQDALVGLNFTRTFAFLDELPIHKGM